MNASWQIQADIGFHLGRAYTVYCSKKWANIYLHMNFKVDLFQWSNESDLTKWTSVIY